METASLRAFVAVADSGSFSAAATRLFLSQPAIIKRIATLESELDTRLFDRIGRTVTLTEAGQTLLPRARHILLELDDSIRSLSSLSGEVHGTLRFATSHHVGLHRLPPVLKQYVRRYPQVRLDIRFMDSEQACRAVETGALELAVVTLPPTPSGALGTQRIWHDPLAVVAARDHPLCALKRPQLSDLGAHPAILPASNTYTRQIADAAFARLAIELDVALSINYLETIKMLVSVGIGWALLPQTMLDRQLRALPVKQLRLQRQLGWVAHRDRTLSNAARALRQMLSRAGAAD